MVHPLFHNKTYLLFQIFDTMSFSSKRLFLTNFFSILVKILKFDNWLFFGEKWNLIRSLERLAASKAIFLFALIVHSGWSRFDFDIGWKEISRPLVKLLKTNLYYRPVMFYQEKTNFIKKLSTLSTIFRNRNIYFRKIFLIKLIV